MGFSLLLAAVRFITEKDGRSIDGSALMNDVMQNHSTPTEPTHVLILRYQNGARTHEVKFRCLLNTVSIGATAGEIVTAEVGFQVTGPLQTATIANGYLGWHQWRAAY